MHFNTSLFFLSLILIFSKNNNNIDDSESNDFKIGG